MTKPPPLRRVVRDGFRMIGRLVRHHPASFALAVLGAVFFAAAIIASAVVIGWVTDRVVVPVLDGGEEPGNRLWLGVGAIVGVAAWKAAAITLRRTAAGWLQFRSRADLRKRMIDHQLRLRLGWFRHQATGDLLSISDTDTAQATFILAPLPYGTGATLLLFGTVGLIASYDLLLGAMALVGLVVAVAVDVRGGWRTFSWWEKVQRLRGEVGAVAHESVDGALTVKALGREDVETARFAVRAERLRDHIIDVFRVWVNYRAFVEFIPPALSLSLITIGVFRMESGALTAGDLVTIAYLMSLLRIPILLIGFVLGDMSESLAAWNRVQGILEVDDFVAHGDLAAPGSSGGAAVTGRSVRFGYDADQPVVEDVAFDIVAGRTVAIVGPTGSGKSTIAVLLARLWDPDSGAIHLDGSDLRAFAPGAVPSQVAFVTQDTFLFDDTVTGNITLGLPVTHEEVVRAASLARADEFIRVLPNGYATRLGERGTTLSGGQRQRIALARALVRRPRVLILDDATSAVDPSVENEILQGLRRSELPSTVIVVAYRPSSIRLADEVVYVEEGRIVAHGPVDELLVTAPGFAELMRAYEVDAATRGAGGEGP